MAKWMGRGRRQGGVSQQAGTGTKTGAAARSSAAALRARKAPRPYPRVHTGQRARARVGRSLHCRNECSTWLHTHGLPRARAGRRFEREQRALRQVGATKTTYAACGMTTFEGSALVPGGAVKCLRQQEGTKEAAWCKGQCVFLGLARGPATNSAARGVCAAVGRAIQPAERETGRGGAQSVPPHPARGWKGRRGAGGGGEDGWEGRRGGAQWGGSGTSSKVVRRGGAAAVVGACRRVDDRAQAALA